MASLEKSLRTKLENTVKAARDVAEAGARSAIDQIGVGDAIPPEHLTEQERDLRRRLRIHGRQLGDELGEKKGTQAIERLVEEVAYEHWHRLLFANYLAENQLLMYPDPDGPVSISLSECDDMAADEGARNGCELAARYAALMLPQIFRVESPVFELQLPPERQQQLEKFVAGLPKEVFKASDSLGWVYQFWQANRKETINKSEVKIGARELPAVTQLFTEDYMVDFLLDNTLGAWWAGRRGGSFQFSVFSKEEEVRKAVSLPGCEWNYLRFVREPTALAAGSSDADHQPKEREEPEASAYGSQWQPAAGTFDGWPKTAKELKCLDPCMGSGHFVVAMFERLMALRMAEEKLDERAAVTAVIRDNLFGLEIDPRCTQIAAFNLALAAWRRVGYCVLPPMNLACSGLAPNASKEEWLSLAGDNEKLQGGMERLYELFEQAPVLGSLINPRASDGDLLEAGFHELQPLLDRMLQVEEASSLLPTKEKRLESIRKQSPDGNHHKNLDGSGTKSLEGSSTFYELAVTAQGIAKAAEILAGQFTLVATNVPYLGSGKQIDTLKKYLALYYADSKADLATAFIERCLYFCEMGGTTVLVTPQNWLFLTTYRSLRTSILRQQSWNVVAKLGANAFQDMNWWAAATALLILTHTTPSVKNAIYGIDVSADKQQDAKARMLCGDLPNTCSVVQQTSQLGNPDARLTLTVPSEKPLLQTISKCLEGILNGASPKFQRMFWEFSYRLPEWVFQQSTVNSTCYYSGRSLVIYFDEKNGHLREEVMIRRDRLHDSDQRGNAAWKRRGICVNQMNSMPVTLYTGEKFDSNVAVISPVLDVHVAAVWCFIQSKIFRDSLRSLDSKVNVTNATIGKVPFDLAHWQKVAAEKYPDGLPKPFSSDPTQWLFNGHPVGADQPLQVAAARLVGYEWPRQTGSSFPDCPALNADGLESHADKDGIVCIPPVRGEASASDRLLNLLASAFGDQWSGDVLGRLLNDAGYAGKSLETWLRDGFFAQHLDIFHKRPFIWHIWDGLRDGFSALINYHKLDRKNLETLIYTYLGDWITRQTNDAASGIDGAQERLAAAVQLKKRLELILQGEAPYDIFVRWKPLHQQPIGWEPDINDGVRMNVRPFVSVPDLKVKGAGILRVNPKIKWEKDRGKEPVRAQEDFPWFWAWDGKTTDFTGAGTEPTGDRYSDCHYTLDMKRMARQKRGET